VRMRSRTLPSPLDYASVNSRPDPRRRERLVVLPSMNYGRHAMSSGVFDLDFFPNQILKQHGYPQDETAQQYLQEQAAKHQAAMQQQVSMTGMIAPPKIRELTIREAHGGWILTRRSWPWELVFTDWEKLIAAISEHFQEHSKDGTADRGGTR
jgi:hypothetical protein